jgi:hypothetical protein
MKRSFLVSLCTAVLAAALIAPSAGAAEEVGYFRTRIDPSVAGVFINGEYRGTAAMFGFKDRAIELTPGVYNVEIVDPRYVTIEAKVTITAGDYTVLRKRMKPAAVDSEGPFGELITEGFGNGAVYLDGKYYANTAELASPVRTLLLRPGTYKLKIVPVDGEVVREEEITINVDEALILNKTGATVRRR